MSETFIGTRTCLQITFAPKQSTFGKKPDFLFTQRQLIPYVITRYSTPLDSITAYRVRLFLAVRTPLTRVRSQVQTHSNVTHMAFMDICHHCMETRKNCITPHHKDCVQLLLNIPTASHRPKSYHMVGPNTPKFYLKFRLRFRLYGLCVPDFIQ